jgi:hypothetical protein
MLSIATLISDRKCFRVFGIKNFANYNSGTLIVVQVPQKLAESSEVFFADAKYQYCNDQMIYFF